MSDQGVSLGRGALRALHRIVFTHAPEQAVTILQQAGFASGEGVYDAFRDWVPRHAGVSSPEDIDAGQLSEQLTRFFQALGWGSLTVSPLAGAALAVDSPDWVEAEPDTGAQTPMCFFSAGMLADFLGRLADEGVAAMEVECRSRNDPRCRFVLALPDTVQRVYEQMVQGRTNEEALRG
ncbi:MAG: V4R domain-containing protein [Acidimicrobiales bacterium]